jgi:hypothetical protein
MGIDLDEQRLQQARTLAANEGLAIDFLRRDLADLRELGCFDIVLCIAVLTEVRDFFGAIESLKSVIAGYAFLELDLAKPLLYLSRSAPWRKGPGGIPRGAAITEVRRTKRGDWVISPSFAVLQAVFGPDFSLTYLGRGIRYDMVEVRVRT